MPEFSLSAWGLLATGAAFFFSPYRQIWGRFLSISHIIFGCIEVDQKLSAAVYSYCTANMNISGLRLKNLAGCQATLKSKHKESLIAFEMLPYNLVVFRQGFRFLALSPGKWYCNATTQNYETSIHLWIPRWLWNQDKFIQTCLEHFNQHTLFVNRFNATKLYGQSKQSINVHTDSRRPQHNINSIGAILREAYLGKAVPFGHKLTDINIDLQFHDKPFEVFPFSEDVMKVVETARFWFKERDWYQSKQIPWKLGWLVHGKPGTGKTLLLKCIAQELGIPVLIFDLASMTNEEFSQHWENTVNQQPCMVLFEDFDSIFCKRKNIIEEGKLTFDCVLNAISGMQQQDGIFLAITTNNIKSIDNALGAIQGNGLSSRPGRIDHILEVKPMDEQCRRSFAKRVLDQDTELEKLMTETKGMTAAQFTEHLKRICQQQRYATHVNRI